MISDTAIVLFLPLSFDKTKQFVVEVESKVGSHCVDYNYNCLTMTGM